MAFLTIAVISTLTVAGVAVVLFARGNWHDREAADALSNELRATPAPNALLYDPAMVADLPPLAQRYFAQAITPGTPLCRRVELEMRGTFIMQGRSFPMSARQVLAPPLGFVWQAKMGSGLLRFAGSDAYRSGGTSWTRFRLLGLVPLVRAGGTQDHARASATRMVTEAIWTPASLLPQYGAVWREAGPDRAEVSFRTNPAVEPVVLTLDAEGRVIEVVTQRWSDANPEARYRLQPFGGRMLAYRRFQGFTIPTEVEVGNQYGTADYAPFFRATMTAVRFTA
jgi:hypothetical protein